MRVSVLGTELQAAPKSTDGTKTGFSVSWRTQPNMQRPALGATYSGEGATNFRVWAPQAERVDVRLHGAPDRLVTLDPAGCGYFGGSAESAEPGSLYTHILDGAKDRPDPASRFQPQGVHGPSQVIDSRFIWQDSGWSGLPLSSHIFYEIHVGTFTPEGTFEAVIAHLDYLAQLGITAIELMPVAQFPGNRNWGYDGAYPFAVQNSYGGPTGLKKLVDACHRRGLAVALDVVYNHLGPEGNYLADFGPYFTDVYRTPWGPAINFDGPGSDEVRAFFIENALYWVTEFHIDALRLDAVHAILDRSAQPFLEELGEAVHRRGDELGRSIYVIPESDLNDTRLIRPREQGGYGLDAQWSDDFHHALHVLLTGERNGYYADFGSLADLAKAWREGFVYDGCYSKYRGRRHGNSSRGLPGNQFVVFAQNHDQTGNRMLGERLSALAGFEELKLAAGAVLLAPYLPLLFMGEEYGETAPFLYFVSHSDPSLIEAVRRGRREEFESFDWRGEFPDPQSEATFARSKLHHELRCEGRHAVLLRFYQELIRLRRTLPAFAELNKNRMEVVGFEQEKLLFVRRSAQSRDYQGADGGSRDLGPLPDGRGSVLAQSTEAFLVFNFGSAPAEAPLPMPPGCWDKVLDSTDEQWLGNGSTIARKVFSEGELALPIPPKSLILFTKAQI